MFGRRDKSSIDYRCSLIICISNTLPHLCDLKIMWLQLIRNEIKATHSIWSPIYVIYFCQRKIIVMPCAMWICVSSFWHCYFECLSFVSWRLCPLMCHLVCSHCFFLHIHSWWSFYLSLWYIFYFIDITFPGLYIVHLKLPSLQYFFLDIQHHKGYEGNFC